MDRPVVFITGITGGIGLATAQRFSHAGWLVTGCDRQSDPAIPDIDHYFSTDLADPQQLKSVIDDLSATTGQLNALVNNAAVQICKPVLETTLDDWDQVMAVNLRAAFFLSQHCHPLLANHQGSIINVSSVHAIATSANIAAYATSKGGLVALTRALAIEFAPQIRVNAILPGAIDTPMLRSGLERGHLAGDSADTLLQNLGDKTILGRVGQPKEIAEAILVLADNEKSSFMTGQAWVIDGGATARLSTE